MGAEMTTKQKLKARLVSLGLMTEAEEIKRLYPGRIQRSAGAFVWIVPTSQIGSPDTMATCLKAKTLERQANGEIYALTDLETT